MKTEKYYRNNIVDFVGDVVLDSDGKLKELLPHQKKVLEFIKNNNNGFLTMQVRK